MLDQDKRQRFRSLLAGESCHYTASVFDPVSAIIAEQTGFQVGLLGGSIASMAILGAPDFYVLTLTELVEQVRRISRAGGIPLMVDGDHGYGNGLSAFRTAQELGYAGAAAVTIEDTLLPEPHGAEVPERLVPLAEGIGRVRAAVSGARDSGILVVGRTSAPALASVEDCIERIRAYQAEGVDAIFLRGFRSAADFERICAAASLPLIVDPGLAELRDPARLAAQGVRIALQGHQAFTAAALAIEDCLRALRDGADPTSLIDTRSSAMVGRISRGETYATQRQQFLGRRSER